VAQFNSALGQWIALSAPEFPADIAVYVLGIQFNVVQYKLSGFHNVVTDTITGQPGYFVFCHLFAP
jgi:hypothetical protein